jgi:hypothetical protein
MGLDGRSLRFPGDGNGTGSPVIGAARSQDPPAV